MNARTAVPSWIRAYVAVLLAAVLIAGAAGIEAWPLTGWRLFSGVRTRTDAAWSVTVAGPDGAERPYPFEDVPIAYRGFVQILQQWDRLSASERRGVCDAWHAALHDAGERAADIRLYRIDRDLAVREGRRAAPGSRTLIHACGPAR